MEKRSKDKMNEIKDKKRERTGEDRKTGREEKRAIINVISALTSKRGANFRRLYPETRVGGVDFLSNLHDLSFTKPTPNSNHKYTSTSCILITLN